MRTKTKILAFFLNLALSQASEGSEHEFVEEPELKSGEWWSYIGLALFCTFFAGAMSGLTVGLLSIDMLELEIKEQIGTEEEKKRVKKIIPVLS